MNALPSTSSAMAKPTRSSGFTLVEVMIALMIFFMAVFTILSLLSNTLRNARVLQRKTIDVGMVAAQIIGTTNRMTEGSLDGDFGDAYPDYSWTADVFPDEVATNGLVHVDMVVLGRGGNNKVDARMHILVFDPNFASKGLGLKPP